VSGATSQWKKTAWAETGEYNDRPRGRLLLLYRANGSTMEHTGIMLPDGSTVDARGHAYGVIYTAPDKVTYRWTHYAILPGMDEEVGAMATQQAQPTTGKASITCKNGWVNIREGISGQVITRFLPGTQVEVLQDYGEWCKVSVNVTGYVKSEFLKRE